jgi:hypothetical protein
VPPGSHHPQGVLFSILLIVIVIVIVIDHRPARPSLVAGYWSLDRHPP